MSLRQTKFKLQKKKIQATVWEKIPTIHTTEKVYIQNIERLATK